MLDAKLFNSKTRLSSYASKVWRMVEDQQARAATLNIVDSMEEQSLLEELLDKIKPPYRHGTESMHYLLKTAFRYPPLKHGSRFGDRTMPSFFYASESVQTVLAETAYYRFVLLTDMDQPYQQTIDTEHSAFSVSVKTNKCLDLCAKKFASAQTQLQNTQDYRYCHCVGDWATTQKSAEVIRFYSARDSRSDSEVNHKNINVAIAEPKAIISKTPNSLQLWLCRTSMDKISFSSRETKFPISFAIQDFMLDGKLPRPTA